mmetsp:Transcript_8255/g.25512  ORF Transcript_8255/g.25512 Transcript_8255/m.25512 type:complete len:334 (-) Transcript_8255:87-1088(-)
MQLEPRLDELVRLEQKCHRRREGLVRDAADPQFLLEHRLLLLGLAHTRPDRLQLVQGARVLGPQLVGELPENGLGDLEVAILGDERRDVLAHDRRGGLRPVDAVVAEQRRVEPRGRRNEVYRAAVFGRAPQHHAPRGRVLTVRIACLETQVLYDVDVFPRGHAEELRRRAGRGRQFGQQVVDVASEEVTPAFVLEDPERRVGGAEDEVVVVDDEGGDAEVFDEVPSAPGDALDGARGAEDGGDGQKDRQRVERRRADGRHGAVDEVGPRDPAGGVEGVVVVVVGRRVDEHQRRPLLDGGHSGRREKRREVLEFRFVRLPVRRRVPQVGHDPFF